MSDQAATPKAPIKASSFPMWVLGLVVLVDSADQNILRGVQTLIQKDFALSDTAVGWLLSAFVFVTAITTVPAGYLADRINRRRVLGGTIVAWSALSALSGATQNFVQLLGVRSALGFGIGVSEPAGSSLLTDYYPTQQRGRAFSIQQLALFLGIGIGVALGGAVGDLFGWRWAFVIIGAPGVLTSLLVLRLREPKRGHGDRLSLGLESSLDEEHEQHKLFDHGFGTFVGDLIRGLRDDVKTIITIPTMRYVLVGVGVLLFAISGIGAWLQVYHQRFSGLTLKEATAAVGAMVVIGGIGGTLVGGTVADRYQNRIKGGRIAIPAYCILVGTVVFTFSFLPQGAATSLSLQTLSIFIFSLATPSMRAGLGDAVPAHLRGAGFAAFGLISAIFGAAAPPIIGAISDAADLRIAFLACMPIIFLGALTLLQARKHLDEDVAKVMMAVQKAYQEQAALEVERAAAEAGSAETDR